MQGEHGGVGVREVLTGSPAEASHLLAGEEVLAVDGKKVVVPADVIDLVRRAGIGAHVKLTVTGKTGQRVAEVTLAERPGERDLQRGMLLHKDAPDFDGKTQSGPKFANLSSLKGQVVLVDFFATWCGPCVQAIPHIEKLHKEFGSKGLKVIGISDEAPMIVAGAADRFHMSYSLVSDEEDAITARYHIFALPTIVVIDKQGKVHEIGIADVGVAEQAVRALLAQK
jgi:peroxiredoxin